MEMNCPKNSKPYTGCNPYCIYAEDRYEIADRRIYRSRNIGDVIKRLREIAEKKKHPTWARRYRYNFIPSKHRAEYSPIINLCVMREYDCYAIINLMLDTRSGVLYEGYDIRKLDKVWDGKIDTTT